MADTVAIEQNPRDKIVKSSPRCAGKNIYSTKSEGQNKI